MQIINILKKLIELYKELLKRKKVKYIIIHHTATDAKRTTWQAIENGHKARWNFKSAMGLYMGYQYLITWDGKVHQSRLDTEEGAHTIGYNKNSIGICLTGSFSEEEPSGEQSEALWKLLDEKVAYYGINKKNILGHRDVANKICPGDSLYEWLANYKGEWLKYYKGQNK